MKLSIITPYYKTLEYTKELAKVLEPQLTPEVEWIIIDDGCHETELDKIKAKVIHLPVPSGNASKPRNVGLENAKGEYIAFIDSDDSVSKDYIQKILEKTKEEWDYCYMSWSWSRGHIIINNNPPSWNTSVWNCVYKKSLIGDNKFDTSRNIAEDEDFNKRVRRGIKANIPDVIYYYTDGRRDSLTNRYSRKEITGDRIKCGLLVYQKFISKIGGIETFLYEFFKALHNEYDILFVYDEADPKQLLRYQEYVRCLKYNNQWFECDKYLCASNQKNIADHVIATSGEYYDMIHADFAAMGWKYQPHPKTTKHICVSNLVKKSIEQQDTKPCVTIYNLLEQPKPQKPIMILSAQRFSVEKGANEMKQFAQRLKAKNIPFVWVCFTDNKQGEEDGIVYRKPVLDLQNYYQGFDYFASFSRTESYGYSLVEAMSCGLPLIVRDIPILDELGFVDGKNGYKLNHDMSNIDEVINKLSNRPKFTYKKLDSVQAWLDELGPLNKYNDYLGQKNDGVIVQAIANYYDLEQNEKKYARLSPGMKESLNVWVTSRERADYLISQKLVKELE